MISLDFPEAGFGTVQASFSYADQDVLREADFHVMPGEIHALVGKQNEGKSTLCAILTGELRPSSGWILAGGKPYQELTPILARSLGIEYVGKEARVFPDLTVAENIYAGDDVEWWRRFGLWRGGFARARKWISSYGIELPYFQPIRRLRKEDWLFVDLLGRIRRQPRLLIADETLEQLSSLRLREFMRVAKDLVGRGMSLLWVTHKIEEALETSDRITVLRRGRTLFADRAGNIDRVSLVRLCFSELGKDDGEDVTREQFYELMSFIEAMLRDMPTPVVIADLERRIRFANRSAKKLFPGQGDWAGGGLDDFFRRINVRLAEDAAEAMATPEDRQWHSLQAGTAAGGMLVDVRLSGIKDRGVRIGHMAIIEDVSVREEMRQHLALSDNLASVGLLAAGVAHEVNDPLAIISNYLGYIRHETTDAEVGRAVRLAQEEIVRIQQIVDNLVAFSGNKPPGEETVDIFALAEELCKLLRFHTDSRRVRFRCDGPCPPLPIRASPNEIRQVLLNLLRNSLDAIEGDGEIRIHGGLTEKEKGRRMARLSVTDNGKGLQTENPEDIFRPFVTTKKGQGAHQGLGLSIVYGIVEKYAGRIQARNLERGGCEFTLLFPLAAAGDPSLDDPRTRPDENGRGDFERNPPGNHMVSGNGQQDAHPAPAASTV